MIGTYLASASRVLWRLLENEHVDPRSVFREAGMDPALMDDPRARYPLERVMAAWAKAEALIEDPVFGLKAAEFLRPTDLHALGYAILASGTLRTALQRIVRYVAVVNDRVGFDLEEQGERVVFTQHYRVQNLAFPRSFEDARWAVVVGICREIASETFNPVEVRLQHSDPTCRGDYFDFFHCPVQYGSEASALVFDESDLDRPLPAANRELARANDQILADFVSKLGDDDIVIRVKAAIIEHLPSGAPTAETIAKDVYTSPRTLRRRLADAGTTFKDILETVRRELAEQYVADPTRPLTEITYLLGFSELSAFSRAFRRWTGTPPSTLRETATA